jgi:hypothetical protein
LIEGRERRYAGVIDGFGKGFLIRVADSRNFRAVGVPLQRDEVVSRYAAATDDRKADPTFGVGQSNLHQNEPTAATATAKL